MADTENITCLDCKEGMRLLGGYIENGKPKGPMGICYRCHGKGFQTPADVKRNENYDRYYRKVSQ